VILYEPAVRVNKFKFVKVRSVGSLLVADLQSVDLPSNNRRDTVTGRPEGFSLNGNFRNETNS